MATKINISRGNDHDPYDRYKMDRLETKIEGKGNGIKTVVVNLSTVAQSLARPGSYLIKYFGFELGAQTNIHPNPKGDRWIINGAHDAAKLQGLLDGFINKFVLCKKCGNPETNLLIEGSRVRLHCQACGIFTDADNRHKLSGFILKPQAKKVKMDKAERRAAKKAKQQNGNGVNGHNSDEASEKGSGENGDAGNAGSDGVAQKAQEEAAEASDKVEDKVEDKKEVWTTDMTEAAVKARQASAPVGLVGDDDGHDKLKDWIKARVEGEGDVDVDNVDSAELYHEARKLGIETKPRTVREVVQNIFDHRITSQIDKRVDLLEEMIDNSDDIERNQRALLDGTECLIHELAKKQGHPEIYKQVSKVLLLYYHHDLASKGVLTKWRTKASKKHVDADTAKEVREHAEEFFKALAKVAPELGEK